MSDRPGGEPTEAPTEKKLRDSFKEGRVAFSTKLIALFQLTAILVLFSIWSSYIFQSVRKIAISSFNFKQQTGSEMLFQAWDGFLDIFLPLGLGIFLVSLVGGFSQVGFKFNHFQLLPKLSRISIKQGFKRIFSKERIIDMFISLLAIFLIMGVSFHHIYINRFKIFNIGSNGVSSGVSKLFDLIISFSFKIFLLLGLFAVVDYIFIKLRHNKSLLMTKYEVEKEMKQQEGDPRHKSERQRIHMEISMAEQLDFVKEADVIVVNPDHVAVAIKKNTQNEIEILAQGKNIMAERIKKEARRYGIPILKDVKLAREMLTIDLGDEIPDELKRAVMVILLSIDNYKVGK